MYCTGVGSVIQVREGSGLQVWEGSGVQVWEGSVMQVQNSLRLVYCYTGADAALG